MENEFFEVIKAEDAAVISKRSPERRATLLTALKEIDSAIRARAEQGFRSASCKVLFNSFDLEEAIIENLDGYSVTFYLPLKNEIGVLVKW